MNKIRPVLGWLIAAYGLLVAGNLLLLLFCLEHWIFGPKLPVGVILCAAVNLSLLFLAGWKAPKNVLLVEQWRASVTVWVFCSVIVALAIFIYTADTANMSLGMILLSLIPATPAYVSVAYFLEQLTKQNETVGEVLLISTSLVLHFAMFQLGLTLKRRKILTGAD